MLCPLHVQLKPSKKQFLFIMDLLTDLKTGIGMIKNFYKKSHTLVCPHTPQLQPTIFITKF